MRTRLRSQSLMKSKAKKGASEALMFVLFIGFVIAVGMGIFLYQKNFVNTSGEKVVRFGESRLECEDVFINVKNNSCSYTVTNTGTFSIDQLVVRPSAGGVLELKGSPNFPLKPKMNVVVANPISPGQSAVFFPVIVIDDETFACSGKSINVSCP